MVEHVIAVGIGGGLTALFLVLGARAERRRANAAAGGPRPIGSLTLEVVEGGVRGADRVVRELEARIRLLDRAR